MTQFVLKPTRLNNPCSLNAGNILDIILSNDPQIVNILDLKDPLAISDHCVIDFSLYLPDLDIHGQDVDDIVLTAYDWSAGNYHAINEFLCCFDWNNIFGFNFNADAIWNEFKAVLWHVISLYVPRKLVSHNMKYRPRQYSKRIRNLLSRKAAIWRKLRSNNVPELKRSYIDVANKCKLEILNFDIEREYRILQANNLGAFYKFVNSKLSSKSGIAPLYDKFDNLVTPDGDKANLLNEYFYSVFTKDDCQLPPFPLRIPDSAPGINDINISPETIMKLLGKLKSNSAAGPDGLPPFFFNKTKGSLNFPLSIMYRTLIDLHTLPSEWRLSIITPVFKKALHQIQLTTDPWP